MLGIMTYEYLGSIITNRKIEADTRRINEILKLYYSTILGQRKIRENVQLKVYNRNF